MPLTESPASQQETMFEEQTVFDPSYEEEAVYEPADELSAPEQSMDEQPAYDQVDRPEPAVEGKAEPTRPVEPAHPVEPLADPSTAHAEPVPEAASDPHADPHAVLTVDDFAALEERVLRAVELVRRERHARVAAEERTQSLQAELTKLQSQTPAVDLLRQEVESLRLEREQVRQRVERLLSQLDALEL